MTKTLKKTKMEFGLTLFLAFLGLAACVACVTTGSLYTFAWFSTMTTGSVNFSKMVAYRNDVVSSVAVHPYDKTVTETAGIYTFKSETITTNILGDYSILNPKGNSVLLEITLSNYTQSLASVTLSAHSDASYYQGEVNSSGQLLHPLQASGNSLSSIVCYYAFNDSSVTKTASGYNVPLASTLNEGGAKERFIQNNALVKDVPLCAISNPPSVVYIVVDYDVELVESLYSANLGSEIVNGGGGTTRSDGQNYLSYNNDFRFYVGIA